MQRIQLINITNLFCSILSIVVVFTAIRWSSPGPVLRNGIWRSAIHRSDGQTIIFNIQTNDSAGNKIIYVLNGSEKLLVDNVKMKGDSVFIEMPFFDSGFAVKLDEKGNMRGSWVRKLADSIQVLPFTAVFNQPERFHAPLPPLHKISGRWSVIFTDSMDNKTEAVGEFKQQNSRLTGTFLTSTGDYRYLDGVVSGDSLKLSGFDGGHAFYFVAKINDNNHISAGTFYSGAANKEHWVATRNNKAALPDGYAETTLRPGEQRLNFTFTSTDGKPVSINDAYYKNKVVIIQIMGSWCPNCMDETKFLSEYYSANKNKGLEVIGLAYERTTDWERSKKSINAFQKRFNVNYPILITGVTVTDTLKTEKTLPQLNNIKGFPTSIFIDKKGVVRKIYTGFTGPGTGEYYTAFTKEFDGLVKGMLDE